MPRLYVRKARKNIYKIGYKMAASNKQGFIRDRSIPAKPADGHDVLLIKKGDIYYTWHPKGSDWQYSLERPDLRSAWDQEISEFQDRINQLDEEEENYEDDRQELASEIEKRRDELQENLDRMPEQLQESSVLNERIEELDNLLSEI